ncbi:fimbrial protein [Stenotrophomonas sp. CFBP 13718]|uniref:fimbrial protein n=1 Tax=Stenotrophomonas sp. CFBP 13718 TaxID=2775304 RepID=UPI00177F2B5D|nr:fimbrial protein [Stenotrophomonas sp. CFBP 13718]MBD8695686.1 type 1 fimbrial protein [Stenotrophomonas sp. CFBP 13718]
MGPPITLITGALLASASAVVSACTVVSANDTFDAGEVILADETRPDILLFQGGNSSDESGLQFSDCPSNVWLDFDSTPSMAGLTYVRDVPLRGRMYPAYGWGPRSPLIALVFFQRAQLAPGGGVEYPFNPTTSNSFRVSTGIGKRMGAVLRFFIYSRGGQMTDVAPGSLMSSSRLPAYPADGSMLHALSFSLKIPAPTCTLSNTSLDLAPITATELARVGDAAGARDLRIGMNCPRDGATVELTLRDALDPANRGSTLTPVAGTSSQGAAIQLMRSGLPVRFGASWVHGTAHAGDQTIDLAARYLRTGTAIEPGTLQGQATLTATYR